VTVIWRREWELGRIFCGPDPTSQFLPDHAPAESGKKKFRI
jgi:hypothetical protein